MKKVIAILLFAVLPSAAFGQHVWQATSSTVSFKIRELGLPVVGKLSGLRAKLTFNPDTPANGSLYATVDVATIKTNIKKRDAHLKKEKFFDAEQYKRIEVKSTKLYIKDAQFAGMFDVTIKGKTRHVEIPFEFNQLGNEAEFKGTFSINRRDFGVGSKTILMADYVTVTVDVKAKR
ncbi:MAG: YceI family protein [Flavipsychrobacter sp.]|nr:YceI family protein [Flavipsychrobacter sp.]